MHSPRIRLVITAALKAELPLEFLKEHGIRVVTLKGLRSGALNMRMPAARNRGVLFVVTGPGRDASIAAARWIIRHLDPVAVLNMGTAGISTGASFDFQPGLPVMVHSVSSGETGNSLKLPDTLPFPLPAKWRGLHSAPLVTVDRASSDVTKKEQVPPGCLIDMEAWYQADCFRKAAVPFHVLKFLSDRVDRPGDGEFFENIGMARSMAEEIAGFVAGNLSSPVFSVIIPVFNRPAPVLSAVESVLRQKYPASEIVVVNDGSTDETGSFLDKLAGAHRQVKVVNMFVNRGVSAARNRGIASAENEWIALLDSDDRWTPDKLEKDAEFILDNPFYEIFQSDEQWIRDGRRVNRCRHHLKPEGWIFPFCVERCMISPSAVVMKKDVFEEFGGFDETLPVCEDYDLWLRISRRRMVGLNRFETVVKYGGASDQLSTAFPAMDRFRVKALLKIREKERDEDAKRCIDESLRFRLGILINGAMKRGLERDALFYREILENQVGQGR